MHMLMDAILQDFIQLINKVCVEDIVKMSRMTIPWVFADHLILIKAQQQ